MLNFAKLLLCRILPYCYYAEFHNDFLQHLLEHQPCSMLLYFKKYHWHWLMDFLLLEYTSVKMKNDWCIFPYRMYFSQMTEGFSTLRNSISQWTEPILEMLSHLKTCIFKVYIFVQEWMIVLDKCCLAAYLQFIIFTSSYSMQSTMSPMSSPSMNSYNSTFSNNMMGSPLTSM